MTEEMLVKHIYKELDFIWSYEPGNDDIKIGRLVELERLVRCFLQARIYFDLIEDIGNETDAILSKD